MKKSTPKTAAVKVPVSAALVVTLPEGQVRTTPDKRVSVFDAITVATGAKDPHSALQRLCKRYPEVPAKCGNFKFPGPGQRATPVADREGFLYILGLLPGKAAAAFRAASAHLVLRYLDGDPMLAEDVIDAQEDPAVLERLAARAKGKAVRNAFVATIHAHGGEVTKTTNTYAQSTALLNAAAYGCSAKQIKAAKGVKTTRDAVPNANLVFIMAAEQGAMAHIRTQNAFGHIPVLAATSEVANDFAALRLKYGIPDVDVS